MLGRKKETSDLKGRIWSEPILAQIRCDDSDLMFFAKNETILAEMTARWDKMPQMQSSPLLAHPGMLRHRICRSVDLVIASEEKKTLRTPNICDHVNFIGRYCTIPYGTILPYIADCKSYFLFKRFLFMFVESKRSMASHRDEKKNSICYFTILVYCTFFLSDLSSIASTSQLGKLHSPHDAYQ